MEKLYRNFFENCLTKEKCNATIRFTTKEVMQLNVMQYASELILHMIVIVAVIQDFKYMRISNRLIIMGLILSLVFGIFLGGVPRIFHILVNISFPVVMLYLLYLFYSCDNFLF